MKIPDDVYETRCSFCLHRTGQENIDIPKHGIWGSEPWRRKHPCRIFGLARFDAVPGECQSFQPNWIYGICYTCRHDSSYCAPDYCILDEQPNKRRVYLGCDFGGGDYWKSHVLCTCDNYSPRPSAIDIMRRQAEAGIIPRNFDPETMKPVGEDTRNEAAEKWALIDQKAALEADRKRDLELAKKLQEQGGQLSLFDME